MLLSVLFCVLSEEQGRLDNQPLSKQGAKDRQNALGEERRTDSRKERNIEYRYEVIGCFVNGW